MEYTNSSLTDFTQLSPNHSGQRTHSIDRITPHCYVGKVSVERMGKGWAVPGDVSANYGIGYDGRIGLYVEEKNRSWCSSDEPNDQRAITIECACDVNHPYTFSDATYKSLIRLCTDICKRNGKTKLLWLGNKTKSLNYKPASNEMVLTVHRWFAAKACPGDWLYSRLGDLAEKVTANLGGSSQEDEGMYYVVAGTFNKLTGAQTRLNELKAAGFEAYISRSIGNNTSDKKEEAKPDVSAFKIGDQIKLHKDAMVYNSSTKFKSWVYNSILYVREIDGSRVVVSTQKTGAVTGAVDIKYLIKI